MSAIPRHATALETLRVTVPETALDAYQAALAQVCGAVGFFLDEASGLWTVEGVREQGAGEPVLAGALSLAAAASGVEPALSRTPTPAEDWLARTAAAFPEQRIGRFAIRGTHLPPLHAAGSITLVLDAALAFGSGEHATTRLCLRALERVAPRRPHRILDLGTGTGVLAMAAARLLRRPVLAADIDPWSVRTAAANAQRNGLRLLVRTHRADGWRTGWPRRAGPYDLVLANILAGPLAAMAPELAAHLAAGGSAILSGLLARQAAWVLAAHRAQGLVLERRLDEGGWTALILRRRSAQPARRCVKSRSNTRCSSPRTRPTSASS